MTEEYKRLEEKIDRLQLTIQAMTKSELNVHEASALLGFKNSRTLYNKYQNGEIQGHKIDGKLFFKKEDII